MTEGERERVQSIEELSVKDEGFLVILLLLHFRFPDAV